MMEKLSPSAIEIYEILKEGPKTSKTLLTHAKIAPRTLRYALKKLLTLHLIKKYPNFSDLRQSFYEINDA